MPIRRLAFYLAGLILMAAPAAAQDTPEGVRPYRFTVEGYAAQGRFDGATVPGDQRSLGGYGRRVMFNRSTPAATLRGFFDRASVGAFTTYTAKQGDRGATTLHYGVQSDVSLFPRPVFRSLLDPFVSVGLGGMRRSFDALNGGGRDSDNSLAVTPAIGTRLGFPGGFGFRGDLRAPVVFGNSTSINAVAEGGVYISF
jgi:hypothetical protein